MTMLARDRAGRAKGVTLTGWTAVAGMLSLIALLVYGAGCVSVFLFLVFLCSSVHA